ncbi:MAG: DUF5916 domain-containing protein [Pseudomonadota bacterium]
MNRLLSLCASLALIAGPAAAAFQAQRIASPAHAVKLDGVLDEAVWQQAPVHDNFFENQPLDKVAAKVRTEVRIAYDDKYFYIGVKAFDPDPQALRAPFTRRDKISGDQDFIGLFLDPSGARKSAQILYINPRGAFTDGIYSDTNGEDFAPDFDVDVATARFDGGWSAEVRIPFSSIAYAAGQGAPWNLLVMRNMTRETRYKMFSGAVTRTSNCLLCFSEPVTGLQDLPTGLNWTATPQLVLRHGHEDVAGQPRRAISGHDLSLDVKLRPDSATIIDATVNPDFSQIELDAPQLSGNTRFGLFVQEKRPFFLEGSDIFQTPLRAINTRAISDPAWGARYTRRDAGSDLTILTTHDVGGGLVPLPGAYATNYANQDFGSQATVARANFKQGAFAVGAIGSERSIDGGRGYNRVAGPDFSWQRNDTERMRGQLLVSSTTAQPDASGELRLGPRTRGHAAFLDFSHEEEAWAVYTLLDDLSDGFRNDNGFFPQVGYHTYVAELTSKQGKSGPLDELNFYFHGERRFDQAGALIYKDYTPGVWMRGPYDGELNIRIKPRNRMRVKQGGELFQTAQLWFRLDATPGPKWARISAEVELGDEIDVAGARLGKGGFTQLYARLRPHDRLEFEPSYALRWIDGKSGPEAGRRLYTEQALQLNGIYHFGPRDTLRMILQKARTTRNPALYTSPVAAASTSGTSSFVYGHTAGLGTATYLGLTLSDGDTPGYQPKRRQNELFVKLSWQI